MIRFLNPGKNSIKFKVLNKNTSIDGNIYFWKHDDKIVISDIDGTVTKSDALGHLLPRFRCTDWAHEGIANLYTNIASNGYKLIYLSSRPIGLSENTKNYI